ncbi:V-type ATP synthase subunit B [Sulfurovum sp. CS9]|uniref:V-type ATP synthase subunit B n=1 Tax=Sulfurovum sp. CS9 TaxID=3391146 RepID=UPI0039E96D73
MIIEYTGAQKLKGSLLFFEPIENVQYGEKVVIRSEGKTVNGKVAALSESVMLIEILGEPYGLNLDNIKVRFTGNAFELGVSEAMLGRVLNAFGEPTDAGGEIHCEKKLPIGGSAYNPAHREYPKDFIQTGISAIDGLNVLVKGQKLPVFSVSGAATNELAAQLVRQIRPSNEKGAVVFAAIGIKYEDARYLMQSISGGGNFDSTTVFLNLADEPSINALLLVRSALTFAEYLAFERGYDVITVLYDMTNYCDALREVSSRREEIPSRKGYPGYMYSDLASIYERAGILQGKAGSLTQIPILTMPDGDITHPIPDLTGYITEGQIVLERELQQKGIYPPINVLPSLSRLMNHGATAQHRRWSAEIYAAYAKAKKAQMLAAIIGEGEMGKAERDYLAFGKAFESRFVAQGNDEERTLDQTLAIGWELLKLLPIESLTRLKPEDISEYLQS